MVPRRVRLKGFLSYRDEVTFDFDAASLWILSGPNGAGKSSVFDAITFALYGLHRNGRQNLKELINTQSDSLKVEFDFRTGGKNYRIARTVSRNEASTFYAARLADGADYAVSLEDDADRQSGTVAEDGREAEGEYADETDKKDGLNAWVERIVGLDEKTFTASVLLRQGEGDKILKARPRERFDMLRRIVDLSHYERLHKTALRHQTEQNGAAQALQQQLVEYALYDAAEIERVTVEIARLETAIAAASDTVARLDKRKGELAGLIESAQLYAKLNADIAAYENEISELKRLLADATDIRRKAARLGELTGVVPVLEKIVTLRGHVKTCGDTLQKYEEAAQEWIRRLADVLQLDPTACSPAKLLIRLDEEINRLVELKPVPGRLREYTRGRGEWTDAGTATSEAHKRLQTLAADITLLKPERRAAQTALEAAITCKDEARQTLQAANLNVSHADAALTRFNTVSSAQNCSYCGLPLTPEHLDKERAKLELDCRAAREAQGRAQVALDAAESVRSAAQQTADKLTKQQTELEGEQNKQTTKYQTAQASQKAALNTAQTAFDALPDAVALSIRPENTQTLEQCFARAYPGDTDIAALETQTGKLSGVQSSRAPVQTLIKNIDNEQFQSGLYQTQLRERVAELPEDWRAAGDTFKDTELTVWKADMEALTAEDVAAAVLRLDQAAAAVLDRQDRMGKAQKELAAIPAEARLPAADLQAEQIQVEAELTQANKEMTRDEAEIGTQKTRLASIEKLTERLSAAQGLANQYETLGRHLGPNGLQMQLLRQAEAVIVANADSILHSISNGMLRLELRAGGVSKALDVVAHNSEAGSKPIPVGFLSGSQKFRVAVSLALGIGQYASQESRSIQSVIIDEGFGSLDKQARGEMIHALQSLTNRLERVIVVSHQDDVTEAFRDRYHISLVNGTSTAEPVHVA